MALALGLLCCATAPALTAGDKPVPEVEIADPYIELRTGPGRGYPIFYVAERGEWIEVIKRRTSWFKVRTAAGKQGWVNSSQLARTLDITGEPAAVADASAEDFRRRRWELGGMAGDFSGADIISIYGGFAINRNLSAELTLSDALGEFSDSQMVQISLLAQPVPDWRASPFFRLGTGAIRTNPSVRLVQEESRTDRIASVGVGAKVYLTRQFFFRVEINSNTIFLNKDDNQEIDEWKLGFGFFF